MSLTVPEPL